MADYMPTCGDKSLKSIKGDLGGVSPCLLKSIIWAMSDLLSDTFNEVPL